MTGVRGDCKERHQNVKIVHLSTPFSKISITQKQLYYYYIQKIEKLKRKKIKSIYEYTHTHENSETLHIKISIAFISR